MTVKELLEELEGVDLNAEVIVWADHPGHWAVSGTYKAHLRSEEDEWETDIWNEDDLKAFQAECIEDGESYNPPTAFVIQGLG